MTDETEFELAHFLPYLLNIAAENTGSEFQASYKENYGLLRTDWRVLFHLGLYGNMTAKEICERSSLHKTKVSRAVARLEDKRWLSRLSVKDDRRFEILSLTTLGKNGFEKLKQSAGEYNRELVGEFSSSERKTLLRCLNLLANR